MSASILTCKKIRHAVVDALKAANIPGIEDKVYPSRDIGAWPKEQNFLCVYTENHSFDDQDTSPVIYKVETTVRVEAIVQKSKVFVKDGQRIRVDIDDQMDDISNFVVHALIPFPEPDAGPLYDAIGVRHFVRLTEIGNTFNGEGESSKGSAKLTFIYTWAVAIPNGEAPNDYLMNENTLKVQGSDDAKNMVWPTDVRNR